MLVDRYCTDKYPLLLTTVDILTLNKLLPYSISADKEFESDAGVPRSSETHGGEDVAIYARGPMAHLFHGEGG